MPLPFSIQYPPTQEDCAFIALDSKQTAVACQSYAQGCAPGSHQREAWLIEAATEYELARAFGALDAMYKSI